MYVVLCCVMICCVIVCSLRVATLCCVVVCLCLCVYDLLMFHHVSNGMFTSCVSQGTSADGISSFLRASNLVQL